MIYIFIMDSIGHAFNFDLYVSIPLLVGVTAAIGCYNKHVFQM